MQRQRLMFDGREVVLIDEHLPPPAPDQVQVRTEWTQVSIGTETAQITEAARTEQPLDLGYSHVGRIERIGDDVEHLHVGDRVLSLAAHASCVNVPASPARVVPVPEGLAPDIATLGILASVAYHIVERAQPRVLEPTAVVGQGVVGSLVLQIARQCGVRPLIALDVDPARLERACAVGADHAVNAAQADAVERVRGLTAGQGVSLCIEAAASASAYATALAILRLRGRLVVSSAVYEPVPFRVEEDIVHRELTIIGAHQPKCPVEPNAYHPWTQSGNRSAALADLRDGRLRVDHLISHRIPASDAPDTYRALRAHDRAHIGVLLDWRDQ